MTPDLARRIEAAARAMATENGDDWASLPQDKLEWTKAGGMFGGRFRDQNEPKRDDFLAMADAGLRAFAPELFTDPPSLRLAPMEATEAMLNSPLPKRDYEPSHDPFVGRAQVRLRAYAAMRDAYLSPDKDKGK